MRTILNVPVTSGETLNIKLESGSPLFVIGPNGSGKSALVQHAVTSLGSPRVRRISAHRQTSLQSGAIDQTPQARKQFEEQRTQQEPNAVYRSREWNPQGSLSSVLFDLVAKDNDLARRIMDKIYAKDQNAIDKIVRDESRVFEQLNTLLDIAGLGVSIENSAGEEILARRKGSDRTYSIAQMSDGERNAVILAANVLTVQPGIVLLIDEPERHLHRSIIAPFLSALFAERKDCLFVVSTHDTALPMTSPEAPVLVLRSCQWEGDRASAWDAVLLERPLELPEELKRAILGARSQILFVEGEADSLDVKLYSRLFSNASVVPIGGCEDVIKAVHGLQSTNSAHRVQAFGLIDRDNRENDEVERLSRQNVYALNVYSVESLYYCSDAIQAVAQKRAELLNLDTDAIVSRVLDEALKGLDESSLSQMAAKRCERRICNLIRDKTPNWEAISRANTTCTQSL